MLHRMNAFWSLAGTTMADGWPMAHVMAGTSAVPVSHAIDLAFLFPDEGRDRHDALIAEVRRHLGGCVHTIEMALRLSLAHDTHVAAALDRVPDPLCWSMICARPTLLAPGLLAHMRMRAGMSLLLRPAGQPDIERAEEGEALLRADDSTIGESLSALMLAQMRWIAPGGEELPMRPDLPAEYFSDLLWSVAACLATVVQRGVAEPDDLLPAAFERSGWALLADHDESASPIAEAERLVRRLGERADAPELLGDVLDQRQFLLFSALTGRHLRLGAAQVADLLVSGQPQQLAALCCALGGSGDDFRHLLLALQPARPSLTDAAIVSATEAYRALKPEQAQAAIALLRTPASFRAKLHHLMPVAPA
jgi:hypothetical protein